MNERSSRWFGLDAGASNWLWASAAVIVLDQLTKLWIISNLRLYEAIEVNAFFKIVRMHNEGAAFSILADASGWQRWFFITLGIVVSIAILIWLRRLPSRGQHLVASGLALILGGALGNVIDRVVHGHVVDFIYLHYEDRYFPAFNVADSAITVGAALLIIDSLREAKRERAARVVNDGGD